MFDIYRKRYRELYFGHWWWRAREEIIVAAIRESGAKRGGRILDVGCGAGLLLPRLEEFGKPEGIESDPELVREGGERFPIHLGEFDQSFAPRGRYELILMLDVLEHLERPERALRHGLDLLTATGRILLTVPAHQWLWTTHDDLNVHLRRYSRRSLICLANESGATVLAMRHLFHWLAAAKLAVRAKEYLIGGDPSPPRIPASTVNKILYHATILEDSLVKSLPIPLGNSIIALLARNTTCSEHEQKMPED